MSPSQRAWKIAGTYAGFGVAWILLSDHVLGILVPDPVRYSALQTWKGWFYVGVTALLVVSLARRAFQEQQTLLQLSRESEDRLRAIFDGVGDAIFLHDPRTGRILQANSTVEALFGYTPAEMESLNLGDLSSNQGLWTESEALARIQQAAQGQPQLFQWQARRKNGSLFWADVKLRGADLRGQRVVLALVHDISERRAAEEALQVSEERFRALFEQAAVGVLLFDWTEHRIERANQRFCEIVGYSRKELELVNPLEIQHPESQAANREGLAALLKGERREHRLEQRLRRQGGGLVWVDLTVSALPEPGGPPRRFVVVVQDVTIRRQAEAALRESEERYRLLFDANPLPMWVFDQESLAFLAVNDAAVASYGWSRAEFLRMRISDIRPPEDLPALLDNLARGHAGRDEAGIWRHLKKSGEEIQVEITSHTLDFALHRAELVLALDVTERLRDRRRLEESEQRFREIFDSMHDAVFIHDAETGRILQVNRRTLDLYGVREEDVLAGDFDRFSCGEEGYTVREAGEWLRKAREEGPQLFEWRSRTAGGHVFWAEVNLRYVLLGDQSRILAVVRDISQRKAAEADLLESESRYRTLFRSLTSGFALHEVLTDAAGRPSDYVFLEVNPAYEQMTGLRATELIGRRVREVLPQVEEEWIRRFGAVALSEIPDAFERYSPETGRHYQFIAYAPRRGQFALLMQDQSETLRMLDELRTSSRRLELVHAIDSAVLEARAPAEIESLVLNGLLRLVPCPRISLALFDDQGQGEIICVAGDGPDLRGPGTRFRLREQDLDLLRRSQIVRQSVEDLRTDLAGIHGELVNVGLGEFLHLPLVCGGGLLGSLNLCRPCGAEFSAREREIGLELACQLAVALHQHRLQAEVARHSSELERRVVERTAQLQAANEELEAFTYSVSHDLRSPLRAVDGFSRMLEEDHADALDAEARRLLGVIRDSTRQMDRLIFDLLSLSRVSRVELRREWVDMEALVREVYPEISAHEADGGCALELGGLPPVWGDRGLLRQVWLNLLGNAVKFSRHAAVKRVEVTGDVQDGVCRYSVRDQGAGFDPAYGHKLFGVFQRLHAAHEYEGSGVGLALVQRIVRRHGGQVQAEGEPAGGACFHFRLPEHGEES